MAISGSLRAGSDVAAGLTVPLPVRRLSHDRLALVGLAIVATSAVLAIAAPLLAPYDPAATDAMARLAGPSAAHPLGTDNLGRDLLSRLLWGSRWSLGTAALATVMILAIGVTVGAVAGYAGGKLDEFLMRIVDLLLAFPSLLLALAIAGTLGPGIVNVMIGMVAVWWASYARIVRGLVLEIRERPFVQAARALGFGGPRILFRHVVPNVITPVVTLATLEMGELVLAVSALNFLGIGAQPPTPEWGAMLNEGRAFLLSAPQLMIYPGLAITTVVLGFNLLGDGLRDALDPRRARRSEPVADA